MLCIIALGPWHIQDSGVLYTSYITLVYCNCKSILYILYIQITEPSASDI